MAQWTLDPATEGTGVELPVVPDPVEDGGIVGIDVPTPPLDLARAAGVGYIGDRVTTRDYRNRTVELTLDVRSDAHVQSLQAKAGKLQDRGGTARWDHPRFGPVIFDVVSAGFQAGIDEKHYVGRVTTVTLTLECLPFARAATIVRGDHVETTAPVLVFTEADIPGDVPALGRLVVDNDSGAGLASVWWGIQNRWLDLSDTGGLFFQAETGTLEGGATVTAGPTGAYGTTVVEGPLAAGDWYRAFRIGASAGDTTTHVGTFRVLARVQAPATPGTVSVRLAWSPYFQAPTTTNPAVALEDFYGRLEGSWQVVDLGTVDLPEAAVGTQGWQGYLEATSAATGDSVYFDWIALIPASEGSGVASSGSENPMLAAGRSIEFRHDGALMTGSPSTFYVSPQQYHGDPLLVPPCDREPPNQVRVIVFGANSRIVDSRGSGILGTGSDSGAKDLSAHLEVTPRYLVLQTTDEPVLDELDGGVPGSSYDAVVDGGAP